MAAKMKTRFILISMLLVAVAGCGHPLIPQAALDQQPSPAAARQSQPVLGVDLYVSANYPMPVIQADGTRNLYYIKRVLGAGSVGIVWNLYSPSLSSEAVRASGITLSPAKVGAITREAMSDGLSVEYRPLIRVGPKWHWEGSISPPDPAAWIAHLYDAEAPYLRLAQRLHVSRFVVSTELKALDTSNEWPSFFRRVAKIYHGTVSYAAYQSDYFAAAPRLLPVSWPGVDPYPDLHLPDTATQHQLIAAWAGFFRQVPPAVLARTTLEEVGFAGVSGAYNAPQNWNLAGQPNSLMTARWFTAACTIVHKYHLRGIYFYEVNITDNPLQPLSFPAFFVDRPGARAIAGCRSIFRG
jgi:Glycoside Hydrolase Family 113